MQQNTDLKFKARWFSEGNFELLGNELIWWRKKLSFKHKIIPTFIRDYYSLPVNEVAYLAIQKRFFGILSPEIHLGTKEIDEDFSIKVTKNSIEPLINLLRENNAPAFSDKVKIYTPQNTVKSFKPNSKISSIWAYDDIVVGIGCNNTHVAKVKPQEVRFYSTCRSYKHYIIPRNALYFGFMEQIKMSDINNGDMNNLREHLIRNNAPFAQKPLCVHNPTWFSTERLNPKMWFVTERVSFTEDAVIFLQRTLKGSELMYIPYNTITFAIAKPKWGIFPSRVMFLGQQNVMSTRKFSADVQKKIMSELDNHVERIKREGRLVTVSWLSRICGNFRNDSFVANQEGIGMVGKDREHKKKIAYCPIEGISHWYWMRKHWYSLVGALWISGNYGNIRDDQYSGLDCFIKDISIWNYYFKGWIKKLLLSSPGERLRDKDEKKGIKELVFSIESKSSFNLLGSIAKKVIADNI